MPQWQEADADQQINAKLIEEAQNGKVEAFGELYERHAANVFRFIYSHLDNREDAEDLTEEVFFRVWRSIENYSERGTPFAAYLFRVARNALIDFYRRSSRMKPQVELEENTLRDEHQDPGNLVAAQLEHRELRQMLTQLREDYRTVLQLRFLADLSPEETAQVMGKSSGAVRVLQHRALAALRHLLDNKA